MSSLHGYGRDTPLARWLLVIVAIGGLAAGAGFVLLASLV